MQIILANPRGFCAGVDRAILLVERALMLFGKPVYVRHAIVHNQYVVRELTSRGAIFVEDIADVPPDNVVIFSAHGSSQAIRQQAEARQLRIFDAICPLVTKVHMEVRKFSDDGYECILIGHQGHPEVEGTMGQFSAAGGGRIYLVEDIGQAESLQVRSPARLAYVTQTTLSVDDTRDIIEALKRRFPLIKEPPKDDICYATQNRQDAVKKLTSQCDLILVLGSRNSSNSNRLCEIARRKKTTSYLIDNPQQINAHWLKNVKTLGITAGASAPEKLVQDTLAFLRAKYKNCVIRNDGGKREQVVFNLPASIRNLPLPEPVRWKSLSELGTVLDRAKAPKMEQTIK